MKASVLSLLLVILAVSWVTAAPYPEPEPRPYDPDDGWDIASNESYEGDYIRKKRQLHGGLNVNRNPYGRSYGANLGYNRVFNKGRTSVGVNAYKNWGAGGRSHGARFTFKHKFGR